MAHSLNQCSFIGNLGKDPEVRYLPSGGAVTSFSIAVADDYKDKQTGQMVEQTEWVPVTMYGKLAEIAGEYLRKGSKVFIQGKFKTRKYQDKQTGADRYSTSVVADTMQMLDSKPQGGQQNNGYQSDTQYKQQQRQRQPQQHQPAPVDDFDDDIPF